jgi:hypothetical protein
VFRVGTGGKEYKSAIAETQIASSSSSAATIKNGWQVG